jgi:hypothetical protein
MNSTEIKERLNKGDQLIEVKTSSQRGYTEYIRFLSDGETAPIKCLRSKSLFGYCFTYEEANIIHIPQEIAVVNSTYEYYNVKEKIEKYLKALNLYLSANSK